MYLNVNQCESCVAVKSLQEVFCWHCDDLLELPLPSTNVSGVPHFDGEKRIRLETMLKEEYPERKQVMKDFFEIRLI